MFSWIFESNENDPSVDSAYYLFKNEKQTNFHIQDASEYESNFIVYEEIKSKEGNVLLAVRLTAKTLKQAKALTETLAR